MPCVVTDCKAPRVPRKSYCIEHVNSHATANDADQGALQDLVDAIANKNADRVKEILSKEQSTEILFKTSSKNMTPIEQAFTGIGNARACGEVMLNWLNSKIQALEKGSN